MNKIKNCLWLSTLAASLLPLRAPAASTTVQIIDFAFSPPTVSVSVGDTVTWNNTGASTHTSTSGTSPTPDGLWTSGFLTPGNTFSHLFTGAGNFPYFCQVHSFMTGSVTVQGAASNLPPVVAINSPTNGEVFTAPANLTLQATASDPDGSVAQVEFFDDSTSVGIVTNTSAANTSFSLPTTLTSGIHTLTARATDNLGATSTSASVTITVGSGVSSNATLTATMSNNTLSVSWTPPSGSLQSTPALLGPATVWSDVGTNNPITLPIGPGDLFLRVRQ